MARSDYDHWNEDADFMWWHEEGKHVEEPPEPDDHDDWSRDAEDAHWEELLSKDDDELERLLKSDEVNEVERSAIRDELDTRGMRYEYTERSLRSDDATI